MTLDELADLSGTELSKLSDEDLLKILSPFFNVTRPELIQRATSDGPRRVQQPALSFEMQQRIKKLAEIGIDVSHLAQKKGKR